MQTYLPHLVFACLLVLNCGSVDSIEPQKSAPTTGSKVATDLKDLDASASDNAFLFSRDYGYGVGGVSGYGGRGTYSSSIGGYPSLEGGSIYGPRTTYRGTGLTPGYRGYQAGGYGNGIIGGGHTGYGYYGGTGAYGSGYGGYGTGGQNYGGIGSGIYDNGYSGYGSSKFGYGGGHGGGYSGRDSPGYNPYEYRGSGGYSGSSGYGKYRGYGYQPSGYRGYS